MHDRAAPGIPPCFTKVLLNEADDEAAAPAPAGKRRLLLWDRRREFDRIIPQHSSVQVFVFPAHFLL